jgi:antitoxin (DNA-binding transcriptional repressor) of toxin-antitoxin stability system
MTMVTQVGAAKLDDLLKQVQAGNEVLLVDGDKPVARLMAAVDSVKPNEGALAKKPHTLHYKTFKGIKVLTPKISKAELAEEMFDQR